MNIFQASTVKADTKVGYVELQKGRVDTVGIQAEIKTSLETRAGRKLIMLSRAG